MFMASWKNMRPILLATNSCVADPKSIVSALKTVNPAITNVSSVTVSQTHTYSFREYRVRTSMNRM